jgi:hypothetical protein
MTKLLSAASAAALFAMAGITPVMAQSDTATTASGGMGMLPTTTCRDISSMESANAHGVFYYIAGLHKGMDASSNQASATSTTGSSTSGSLASSGDTSNSTTATSGSGVDAGDTTASTTVPDSSSTSGSTSGSASGSTSSSSTASNAGSTSGTATTGSSLTVAGLPEFSTINVDQLMEACKQSPDMRVSDVIGKQIGAPSSSAQ